MTLRDIKIMARKEYKKPKKRGDFDIYITCKKEPAMVIPVALYNLIVLDCNATNAQTAMEYLNSRTQTIAQLLGWREIDVEIAFKKLLMQAQIALNSSK